MKIIPDKDSLVFSRSIRHILNSMKMVLLFLFTFMSGTFAAETYAMEGNNAENTPAPIQQQARRTITGTVVEVSGETIIGANIMERGTTNGTITDIDGNFTLSVSPNAVLDVRYVGFIPQEIRITANTNNYRIVMNEDAQALDEVVVIGYGVQKKRLLTGATVQVSGDDLQRQNRTSALGALQGQSPGVTIVQSSGMPGQDARINIRGVGTIGNSNPLYVIDGIPGGNLNHIDPSDIASIDVLKDAASAAIYGARAANGVILVTTRQGQQGKMQLSYDGYYGIQNVAKMEKSLNAQQYMEVMNEVNDAPFDFASLIPAQYPSIQNGTWNGTNWLEEIRNHDAPIQSHAVNLRGGTDMSKMSMGLTYLSQEGIFGNPVPLKADRYTFRLNSDHVLLKAGNRNVVTIGQNLLYTYRESSGIRVGDTYSNDVRSMINANPLLPLYNKNGDYYIQADKSADNWDYDGLAVNPIAAMVYGNNRMNKNYGFRGSLFAEIQPVDRLIYRSVFGYDMSASSERTYTPAAVLATATTILDEVNQRASSGHSWTWQNTLAYSRRLNEVHNLDGLLGMEMEKSGMGENLNARNRNSLFPGDFDYAWLGNTGPVSSSNTAVGGSPYAMARSFSVFGRINYNYGEKYMFTFNLRADGSSVFARGNRWGYFPSVSAGWVMTSEPFMESVHDWMDFFKLRASWGQNGNNRVSTFQYLATIAMGPSHSYTFGNDKTVRETGAYPDVLPNPDITWETSEQLNIGFDARFINSRLGVVFDWYKKTTKDWLVRAPILDSWGTGAPYINGGNIVNQGYEVGLTWNDRINRDFRYGLNFNISKVKNEVTRIANSEGIIHGAANLLFQNGEEFFRAQEGYPVGYFYGFKTLGIFQNQAQIDAYTDGKIIGAQPGDVIFADLNGDGEITNDDRTMIGKGMADYQIGFSVNMEYKGFDFSMTTSGAFGQQVLKSFRAWASGPKNNYTLTDYNRRWTGEGTSNKYPRMVYGTHQNRQYLSDIFLEDADYLKIRNLTIGYDFKRLFPRMPLDAARLYVSVQNLYTFTGYSGMDPEVGYGFENWAPGVDIGFYPSPRTYLIGASLNF